MKDIELMLNPMAWPSWPMLPLKNRENRKCGTLLACTLDDKEPTDTSKLLFVEVNMWTIVENAQMLQPLDKEENYISPVQLIEQGWVVD